MNIEATNQLYMRLMNVDFGQCNPDETIEAYLRAFLVAVQGKSDDKKANHKLYDDVSSIVRKYHGIEDKPTTIIL